MDGQRMAAYLANPPVSGVRIYFSEKEFEDKGFPSHPNSLEVFLIRNLVFNILNPIRLFIKIPVLINDCYRTYEKYKAMVESGSYNPSPTSDHFWGQPVPLANPDLRLKYGYYFQYSVGAVDIRFSGEQNLLPIFNKIIQMDKSGTISVGQCILESSIKDGKIRKQWIHISNPRDIVYSESFLRNMGLQKEKYLVSVDNGKTYQTVNV